MEVTERWSSNGIELDPSQFQESEEASLRSDGNTFGMHARKRPRRTCGKRGGLCVRRLSRATRSPSRVSPVYADDVPAENIPGIPMESPPPRAIPDESMKGRKNFDERDDGPRELGETACCRQKARHVPRDRHSHRRDGARPSPSQAEYQPERFGGGDSKATHFEAATPPINLVPSFEEVNQAQHQNLSGQQENQNASSP